MDLSCVRGDAKNNLLNRWRSPFCVGLGDRGRIGVNIWEGRYTRFLPQLLRGRFYIARTPRYTCAPPQGTLPHPKSVPSTPASVLYTPPEVYLRGPARYTYGVPKGGRKVPIGVPCGPPSPPHGCTLRPPQGTLQGVCKVYLRGGVLYLTASKKLNRNRVYLPPQAI